VGLEVIAITDHNYASKEFIPYLRDAAREFSSESGYELAIFPGFEFTADVGRGLHVLAIFDPREDLERIDHVLTACGVSHPRFSSGQPNPSRKRLTDIIEVVQRNVNGGVLGLVILPHSQENSGIFDTERIADWLQAIEFINSDLLCLEVPKPASQMSEGWQRLFRAGSDCLPEWRRLRPIALIMSSDAKALREGEADNYIGIRHTWIKLSSPTIEGLRQAFLANESRILLSDPVLPPAYIDTVEISACKFFPDRPLRFGLSNQFNAIIGGRGTGKSTLLEYIRWALCDQPIEFSQDDTLLGEIPQFAAKRASLIRDTLKSNGEEQAYVRISAIINNSIHYITRYANDERVMLKIGEGEENESNPEQIRLLFPIQAYSQKQLSTVAVRIEELRRFVESPIQSEIQQANRRIADHAEVLRNFYRRLWRVRELANRKDTQESQTRSIRSQIESLRSEISGLSPEDRGVLDHHGLFVKERQIVESLSNELIEIRKGIEEAKIKVERISSESSTPDDLPQIEKIRHLKAIVKAIVDYVSRYLEDGLLYVEENKQDFEAKKTELNAIHCLHDEAYRAATERAAENRTKLIAIDGLNLKQTEIEKELVQVEGELKDIHIGEDEKETAITLWTNLHSARGDLLDRECQALEARSEGDIRARLKRGGDVQKAINTLRRSLEGSQCREEWLESLERHLINAENPAEQWIALLNEFRALAEFETDIERSDLLPECPELLRLGFTANALRRVASRMTKETWLDLLVVSLDDLPEFFFCANPTTVIPFVSASPGQQATGLLSVLLRQEGGPLLIDQPEEDLDNANIGRIVEGIWKAKCQRQLLIISHNANLVVNGDAEQIIHCDYNNERDRSSGKIATAGSIDETRVRDAITRIMEGGEKAFKLRRAKYGF
jgi:type III restriction enzyme